MRCTMAMVEEEGKSRSRRDLPFSLNSHSVTRRNCELIIDLSLAPDPFPIPKLVPRPWYAHPSRSRTQTAPLYLICCCFAFLYPLTPITPLISSSLRLVQLCGFTCTHLVIPPASPPHPLLLQLRMSSTLMHHGQKESMR
jgi:hypothetical protein